MYHNLRNTLLEYTYNLYVWIISEKLTTLLNLVSFSQIIQHLAFVTSFALCNTNDVENNIYRFQQITKEIKGTGDIVLVLLHLNNQANDLLSYSRNFSRYFLILLSLKLEKNARTY